MRRVSALLLAFALAALPFGARAQPRATRAVAAPVVPPPQQPRPSRRSAERVALAAAQGASDDVVLALTEIRVRRSATRRAEAPSAPPCLHAPVEIRRLRTTDAPRWSGPLTDCAGRPTLRAMAALALLAQPLRTFETNLGPAVRELRRTAHAGGWTLSDDAPRGRVRGRTRNTQPVVERDPDTRDPIIEVAPGARALHPRLLQILQSIAERYPGRALEIISGYRPSDGTSRHAHARALDLRVHNVSNEELRDFARTLPNTGVGYYPNSIFVHIDVRDTREGRAMWTDYSGPGETPRYGHWPPTDEDIQSEVEFLVTRNERELESARAREGQPSPPASPAPPQPPRR